MHAPKEPEPPDCPRCGRSRPAEIETLQRAPALAWFRCRYCAYIWPADAAPDRSEDDPA